MPRINNLIRAAPGQSHDFPAILVYFSLVFPSSPPPPWMFLFSMLPSAWGRAYPFHSQEWSISNFSRSLTTNITSHSMENVAFHSLLRWKMIVLSTLTTLSYTVLFTRLGECRFWAWEWKGYKGPKEPTLILVNLNPSWFMVTITWLKTNKTERKGNYGRGWPLQQNPCFIGNCWSEN